MNTAVEIGASRLAAKQHLDSASSLNDTPRRRLETSQWHRLVVVIAVLAPTTTTRHLALSLLLSSLKVSCNVLRFINYLLCPAQGALSDNAVWRLTSVWRLSRTSGRRAACATGWRVLADRARLGRPGSRLPLRASAAGLGGGISWRPPARLQLDWLNCTAMRRCLWRTTWCPKISTV